MDSYQIQTGESYEKLKQSIVIFLCDFDLFHKNRSVYTFEMRCDEEPTLCLGEKRKTIFVNLNGNREGVSEKLKNLLDYLATSTPTDDFTENIERRVEKAKSDDEWRENIMTIEQKIKLEGRVLAEELAKEMADDMAKEMVNDMAKEMVNEAVEQERRKALQEGEDQKLLIQISKKLAKGKSILQIADECEESEERIRELMKKL